MSDYTDKELQEAALEAIRCHRENRVSLNPYSTHGARISWDHGFDGKPRGIVDYEIPYRVGQITAELIK